MFRINPKTLLNNIKSMMLRANGTRFLLGVIKIFWNLGYSFYNLVTIIEMTELYPFKVMDFTVWELSLNFENFDNADGLLTVRVLPVSWLLHRNVILEDESRR